MKCEECGRTDIHIHRGRSKPTGPCYYCEWRATNDFATYVEGANQRCTNCRAKMPSHRRDHPHQRWTSTGNAWDRACKGYQFVDLEKIHQEALHVEENLR